MQRKPSRRVTHVGERWAFREKREQRVGPFCTEVQSEVERNFWCQGAELPLVVE